MKLESQLMIEVPRKWIKGLIEVASKVDKSKTPNEEYEWEIFLLGYIESAKSLLK